jgi:NitT/TauT family transport system substrate-binding protein
VRAFRAGLVDAVVTFAPVQDQLAQAEAEVLFDSTRVPGKIMDTLVVRAADAEAHKEQLQAFVNSWFRAMNVILQDKERAYPVMARHEQVSPAQIGETVGGLILLDRQQNIKQFSGDPSALLDTSMDVQRILKESGLTAGSDDLSQFINPHLVEGASLD